MLYVILGLSVLFLGLGYLINEKNAGSLLSGYNMMSAEQQAEFDLKGYLKEFKRFHVFLALSFTLLGLFALYVMGENAAGIFLGVYPIIAYLYFILRTRHYQGPNQQSTVKWASALLVVVLLGVIGLFVYGFQESKMEFGAETMYINGMYSIELRPDQVESFSLVDQIPPIRYRMNGFSSGEVRRGYYKTGDGEKVRLLVNSSDRPALLIVPHSGYKTYYVGTGGNAQADYEAFKAWMNQ